MILKTLSRKSNTGQLVKYIFRYIFKGKAEFNSSCNKSQFILRHNIRARSINGFIKEFEENENYRLVHRKDSVKIFHTILSFSNKDKEHINDKLLNDVFKKFVLERGSNNLYAGTKHQDKDHTHLHISVSGTQLNGRSSRISKQQLHHIKIELDKFQRQKFPELINSLPEHGKGRQISKEKVLQSIKAERQTIKETLLSSIQQTYATSKSQVQFLAQLKKINQEPYYRKGKLQGVTFQGKRFRLNRLGFDESKLQMLDHTQSKEEKQLVELKELRTSQNKELKKNTIQSSNENRILGQFKNEQELNDFTTTRTRNIILNERYNAQKEPHSKVDNDPSGNTNEISNSAIESTLQTFEKLRNSIKPLVHERD